MDLGLKGRTAIVCAARHRQPSQDGRGRRDDEGRSRLPPALPPTFSSI